ncbi:hypothetical protein [Streptomyces spirodelae]|uniref:Uncharacterized protein n=1 Tax=Streptomyces spirodelae TaxID=2812904 RepID=A0ABS3X3W1_9ACTN|nr:hypothetical protein [Streptomyces spirodelae]MBO8190073.1 hypothetical protein [Streptomyces spirodelae]
MEHTIMTIATPRLDHFTANGTGGRNPRVLLADGNWLRVQGEPGAAEFQEVYLAEGLDAPDEQWEELEDHIELWLISGEELIEGRLFYDVPVAAVRALIEEHGGERAEQDPLP